MKFVKSYLCSRAIRVPIRMSKKSIHSSEDATLASSRPKFARVVSRSGEMGRMFTRTSRIVLFMAPTLKKRKRNISGREQNHRNARFSESLKIMLLKLDILIIYLASSKASKNV